MELVDKMEEENDKEQMIEISSNSQFLEGPRDDKDIMRSPSTLNLMKNNNSSFYSSV